MSAVFSGSAATRRSVLRGSALAATGLATSSALTAARQPRVASADSGATAAPTFVLVHTAYASAAWWDGVVRELALHGHRALAVDLPGHGPHAYYPRSYRTQNADELRTEASPAAGLAVADYANAVATVVERASAHGPITLVGHGDAGGAAVTRVANTMPGSIQHLVYVDAYVCVDMATMGEYMQSPENSDALLAPIVETSPELGIARVNWRASDRETLDAFHAALAADQSDQTFRATLNSLSPDIGTRLWGDDAQVKRGTWGRVPRTYIRFTRDRTIPLALQDKMILEADRLTPDNPFSVHNVPAPHAGPLDRPEIAHVLNDLATAVTR